jgi:membrane-associated phospholipid phosphatase
MVAWPLLRRALWAGLPALLLLGAVMVHVRGPDPALFLALNRMAARAPDRLWSCLTDMGQTGILFALMSPLLLLRPRWVMAAIAAIPFGSAYSYAAKSWFDAPRPAALLEPLQFHVIGPLLTSHSFPSGHAITAFVAAAAILASEDRIKSWLLPAVVLLLACAVAFSRIAVGAHWPVDVLGGAAGGWLAGLCGATVVARYPQLWQSPVLRQVTGAAFALVGLSLCWLDTGYPLGLPLQWFAMGCALLSSVWQLVMRTGQR